MPKAKNSRKRKQPNPNELSTVCNITGLLDDGPSSIRGTQNKNDNDDVLGCLQELASAQEQTHCADSDSGLADANDVHQSITQSNECKTGALSSSIKPPSPPGIIHRGIPSLKIELSRHLQIETLSKFLLQSCKGLRMPSFERWLLDSKLEQNDRYNAIRTEWNDDPSLKLEFRNKKRKYGRAALHGGDLGEQKEQRRKDKESRLLLVSLGGTHDNLTTSCDPILPSQPLETDDSCLRLMKEITSVLTALDPLGDETDAVQKATSIIRELCSRTGEAVTHLDNMEARLGRYQKFGWDDTTLSGKKKKREKAAAVDKISIEWNQDNSVCSLVYIQKKKRSDSSNDDSNGQDEATKHKPKPFIVKLNAYHYHKLRAMFDKTYKMDGTVKQLSSSQVDHAFRAVVFAMIIRYSSLSGGQQINDLRGGGMQGAIHNEVFDCLTEWFGSDGVECFASPFNCHLSHYYSAFSSPDIDGHFGSYGDFFRCSNAKEILRDGCWYELNPPFSPGVMNKIGRKIDELLDYASEQCMKVTFIVIVPTVHNDSRQHNLKSIKKEKKMKKHVKDEDGSESNVNPVSSIVHHSASTSFNRLVNNSRCISHIVLPAHGHGYVEGSQHLRPTTYKESNYSTSVIVLQSNCGAGKGDSTKASSRVNWDAALFEKGLREAFASRHQFETKQRKSAG